MVEVWNNKCGGWACCGRLLAGQGNALEVGKTLRPITLANGQWRMFDTPKFHALKFWKLSEDFLKRAVWNSDLRRENYCLQIFATLKFLEDILVVVVDPQFKMF